MPKPSQPPKPDRIAPEIISPAAAGRLDELETLHADEAARLEKLEALANVLDAQFIIPVVGLPVGLDFLIGLIPGIGDTVSFGLSGYIVHGAYRLKMPKRYLAQMFWNIFVDWLIGLVPFLGDLVDLGWRANLRNVGLLRDYLETRWALEREAALKDG